MDRVGARMDIAHSAAEAKRMMAETPYALVLVNRIFDGDGDKGLSFITAMKKDDAGAAMMLVSDYPEAQAQAVASGAMEGFGKSQLHDPALAARLQAAMNPAAAG
jgi:ActR/RegA family two-component response regulator